MNGLSSVLVTVALVGLVLVRLFRPQRLDTADNRWWVLPLVLAAVAVGRQGTLDAAHPALSVVLLVAGVVIGLLTGAGWAMTTRLRTETGGTVLSSPTPATFGVWGVGILLRLGTYAAGAALDVHTGNGPLLLSLAVTLLARGGLLHWRARSGPGAYRVPAGT
ncbi:DUF1453 domain-containing protein [Streptomyces sp. NPDC059740]|uniref:DUF1453 domain-containing protein n=1 Tax=Streptomyces sp. NPDC059740 TaxID=3346926 RepID=UPI00364A35A0